MAPKLQPANVSQEVAWRNLSAKQIRALRKQGVEVVDSFLGDVYDMTPRRLGLVMGETVYCIRSTTEVRAIADGKAALSLDIYEQAALDAEPEVGPEKSTGHVGFAHGFEYFWRNGDLYRANLNNPIFPDGYRCGRFESNVHNAAYFLKQAGLA